MLSTILVVSVFLSACQNAAFDASISQEPASSLMTEYIPDLLAIETVAATREAPIGTGRVRFAENTDRLQPQQEQLLLNFIHLYYASLADLEVKDATALFAADASEQAGINRIVWETMVGVRAMQESDLRLTGYSFELRVQTVIEAENGEVSIRAQEDFVQNFAAFPGVDSKGFGVVHIFTLTNTSDGWRLVSHRQADRLYGTIMGRRNGVGGSASDINISSAQARQRRDDWLSASREAVQGRGSQGNAHSEVTVGNEYNRAAAVSYAREWATAQRNPVWGVYDRLGGNCQNFVSQAILAGGVPMDYTAPAQWKWFGDTPSSAFTASGRAPAWTGVNEFLAYVRNNTGFGMVAIADAPFYSGQPGDVIHMGMHGEWRHTVMITQVIEDAQGNTVDYLIASNTANLLDFPVSAYHYQEQMLIRILGWNA